jgi:hypothetical protein
MIETGCPRLRKELASMNAALSDRVYVMVKKGPIWSGGRLDASLHLEGGRLKMEALPEQLGRRDLIGPFKGGAVKRLFGEAALADLKAGRPAAMEFAVGEARISFPRRGVLIELPGKPDFMLGFFKVWDMDEKRDRSAREQRERWREALGGY